MKFFREVCSTPGTYFVLYLFPNLKIFWLFYRAFTFVIYYFFVQGANYEACYPGETLQWSRGLFTRWQMGSRYKMHPWSYTVQTVELILPCIGSIPHLHSCIEKKILLNSLCWLGGKFMLSSSKQVGTGPWFESRTWHKICIKFFKDKLVWIYLWQGLLYFKD